MVLLNIDRLRGISLANLQLTVDVQTLESVHRHCKSRLLRPLELRDHVFILRQHLKNLRLIMTLHFVQLMSVTSQHGAWYLFKIFRRLRRRLDQIRKFKQTLALDGVNQQHTILGSRKTNGLIAGSAHELHVKKAARVVSRCVLLLSIRPHVTCRDIARNKPASFRIVVVAPVLQVSQLSAIKPDAQCCS